MGIFPNESAIVLLVGSQLLERRRFFSEETMAKIPESEEPLELAEADQYLSRCVQISSIAE